MRLRDLDQESATGGTGVAVRPVPRLKARAATSLCGGNRRSYAYARRAPGSYLFDRACYCSSPEQHNAQFADGEGEGPGH
ncbi:MAG TPA: hypothetical protein VII13_15545 [Vicinamibacteria bacterium]|jgi:hypothetical protein